MLELPFKICSINNDENQYIELILTDIYDFPRITSYWGGYDFYGMVKIKINNIKMTINFDFTTSDLFQFLEELNVCHKKLDGIARYCSQRPDATPLQVSVVFNHYKVSILLEYKNNNNLFKFSFDTNQSFLQLTIQEIHSFRNLLSQIQKISQQDANFCTE
ncbi:MAG: hypothetical protein ACI4TE_00650 [Alphaproteobacteria bacterium]